MKKFRLFILALGCLSALSLTSCLSDDDDATNIQPLTQQQVGQCLNQTIGSYKGDLIYYAKNPDEPSDNVDTLAVTWTVGSDTLATISQLPPQVLGDYIKDASLKEAVLQADPQPLKAKLGFYRIEQDLIGFYLYPYSVTFTIAYQGGTHTATTVFWLSSNSYGYFTTDSHSFNMQFLIAALYLDEDNTRNYLSDYGTNSISIPIILSGKPAGEESASEAKD